MKLMRWVEVHIGRSRRKSKKERSRDDSVGSEEPQDSVTSSPLIGAQRSENSWAVSENDGSSICETSGSPPRTPEKQGPTNASSTSQQQLRKPPPHIRTSFLDPPVLQEVNSPRQRSRIRTNPWMPSPRSSSGSSADSGWGGSRSSSGSDSPETADTLGSAGSVFVGQVGARGPSVGSGPPDSWSPMTTLRRARDLGFVTHAERSLGTIGRNVAKNLDKRLVTEEEDSSEADEAYAEDYIQSEDGLSPGDGCLGPQSPQADSACGSDRGPSSFSSTPLSETGPDGSTPTITTPVTESCHMHSPTQVTDPMPDRRETLEDKVQRLRAERLIVEQKLQAAREEECMRREERVRLQRELLQFRQLLLLRTLQGLRSKLEQQGQRLQRAYGNTMEARQDYGWDRWTVLDAEPD